MRAGVDNVTNKNYWASAGGYPGAGYLTVGAPRNYRARNTDKIDICAIATELREAVNDLRQTNGSH